MQIKALLWRRDNNNEIKTKTDRKCHVFFDVNKEKVL